MNRGERVWKVTRNGVFGLSPGIELALVSSSQDARRFHLWEASPLEYLERLHLQNLLVPGLDRLEGVLHQAHGELAIVTSQPRFDIIPIGTPKIDAWFASRGFEKITDSAYYRHDDNLGVFGAHDKNLVRAGEDLIPFDVIPCHPAGGFLDFIRETLVALPPLPEQCAIATALSDVDALLAALDRLLAKKRDLKQGMMQELLTGRTRLVASPQKGGRA